MATIREEIISIIGAKVSTTGENNAVRSFTPQMWLVNDTDLFQIKPFLLNNDFTEIFYNVSTKEYLVWDSKFNIFKPLNGSTEEIFNGVIDTVFFQDEFCEIRWNSSDFQPQFRLKGNIGAFAMAYKLTIGNHKQDSDNVSTHTDLNNWSSWFYWGNGGGGQDMDDEGAQGDYYITQESQPLINGTIMPTYKLTLMKGDSSRITTNVKRILKK